MGNGVSDESEQSAAVSLLLARRTGLEILSQGCQDLEAVLVVPVVQNEAAT